MIDIILIIKLTAFTWFFTTLEPLQEFIQNRLLTLKSYLLNNKKGSVVIFFTDVVLEMLTCWQCLAFWLTFTVTFELFTACITSLIAWILSTLLKQR